MNELKPYGEQATVSIWTEKGCNSMNILITGGAGLSVPIWQMPFLLKDILLQSLIISLPEAKHLFHRRPVLLKQISAAVSPFNFGPRPFDVIYHEAAQTMVPSSIKDPYHDADENIMGLLSLLEAARQGGVKNHFSSSAAIYGDNSALPLTEEVPPHPLSFYGLTKWMTENYLELYHQLYGLDYAILRYSNVYGPRQGAHGEGGVIYIFAKQLAEGKDLTISATADKPVILSMFMM